MSALRTLSSAQTAFLKPLPWLFHLLFGGAMVALVTGARGAKMPLRDWIVFGAMWLFLALFLRGIGYGRIKRIRVGEGELYVSNYRTEIAVPFSFVTEISDEGGLYLRLIKIRFSQPTVFGEAVVFMPKMRLFDGTNRMFGGLRTHPVVAELRALVRQGS